MKKKLILFNLIFLLLFTSCTINKSRNTNIGTNKKSYSSQVSVKNKYSLKVELDTNNKVLFGTENITFTNNENVSLKELYFHIYPNAYKKQSTLPIPFENISQAYSSGFKPGYIEIHAVSNNYYGLKYDISGVDETILKISLKKVLNPGEKIDLSLSFKVYIPPIGDRLGYKNDVFNFGNWYPIVAVYDDTGWNLDPYYPIGDPFYSDTADFNVEITVPKNYIVAATGEKVAERLQDEKKVYMFRENDVRDFAWCTSNKFQVLEDRVDGINIKCYSLNGYKKSNEMAMSTAKNSIKIFNDTFGKYPYKNFSVVATAFSTGMEYPGIVFINKDYYNKNGDKFYLEVTIAHETAHQWWYSIIGNDEIDEAWIDEAMTTYSEVIYYEKNFGKDRGKGYFNNELYEIFNNYKNKISGNQVILKPITKFNSSNDYALLVYYKGAIMLNKLREEVGDEIFFKIIKSYYEQNKYKNVTTQDFIDAVEKVTNKNWTKFFNEWLLCK